LRTSPRRAVIYAIAALVSIYVVCFIAVLLASRQDQRQPADVIVVLGAAQYNGKPSPVLRARLDHRQLFCHQMVALRIPNS